MHKSNSLALQAWRVKLINIHWRWIAENPNAQVELPRPSSMESKTNLYSLEQCQQDGQREDKETTSSMAICLRLHKATQELIKIC